MNSEQQALIRKLRGSIRSQSVLTAMERVSRDLFIPPGSRHMAYLDIALSIGEKQTISQPYIVALMVEAMELQGHEKVLEVGTGSGYQAAILSHMVPRGSVITVERLKVLEKTSRNLLHQLGHVNVTVEPAGDRLGAPHLAPFDAIVVAAAAPELPQSLVDQLAMGGRLVIPVGTRDSQELLQARHTEKGLSIRWLGPCRFVPLVGEEGFPAQ